MKKKGLIISTVVMAIVLIASLTTATYAWFTTTSVTKIDNITISAASGATVKIGVAKNNAYGATKSQDDFVSGVVTFDKDGTDKWTGDTAGLGSSLTTGLKLDTIAHATGMGKAYEAEYVTNESGLYYKKTDADSYILISDYNELGESEKSAYSTTNKYNKQAKSGTGVVSKLDPKTKGTNDIVMADGITTKSAGAITGTQVTQNTIINAVENADYLHFVIGLAASEKDVDKIYLNLIVNPTDTRTTIGITSALHFRYAIDGTWNETVDDIYGDTSWDKTKSAIESIGSDVGTAVNTACSLTGNNKVTDDTALNSGAQIVTIEIAPTNGTSFVQNTEIHQIEFYIFYDGTDTDCITEALGSSCDIIFVVANTVTA